METQNNYKRTVSGSVGAGMGAIFNGSGRTYYILEHKNSSKYHNAGEAQKIIIDQIEIGRDASCQVRFDESFETVSRKHCAIIREGNGFKLVHLSQSNPTLVNGQPINGTYYLQSGDEIQISVGGPRLGFIVPQGRQAMTSSIKLTERMNLFRQQALRPYRTAIWVLAALLLVTILGFGAWNYKLNTDNQALRQEMKTYQAQIDSLGLEKAKLDELEQQLTAKLAADPDNQQLKSQLGQVQQERVRVVYAYNQASSKVAEMKKMVDPDDEEEEAPATASAAESSDIIDMESETSSETTTTTTSTAAASTGGSDNIVNYYNDIYTLKVKSITIERDGRSFDAGIAASELVVGTGFIMNGKFVTARSNIQPWIYYRVYQDGWRRQLAEYAQAGFNIVIDYEAYSTRGSGHPLRFSNSQFDQASLEAYDAEVTEEIQKTTIKIIKGWGFNIKKMEYKSTRPVYTDKSHNAAVLALGAPGGLPVDASTSSSLKGSEEVVIAGFSGRTDIQNLSSYVKYFTSRTSRVAGTFITLQDASTNWGFTGAPAFYKGDDGKYRVIGVNVGNFGGEVRIVPMYRVR
jgi:hypothetical protein